MDNFSLPQLSLAASEFLGRSVEVNDCTKAGGGYHSQGYKLVLSDGGSLFMKVVKAADLGFEFPERKLQSLLVSHSMAQRTNLTPRSLGIALAAKGAMRTMPSLDDDTEVIHFQEFETGDDYFGYLQSCKHKTAIDETDRQKIEAVVKYIAGVHALKHPTADQGFQAAVYNSGLREVLISPELTIKLLTDYPADDALLGRDKQAEYIGLMLEVIYRWLGRSDRLRALHGDFWGTNVFFRPDGEAFAIDYSRIPWGDPGIDICWWMCQYLWFYHETGNSYFRDLGELFLAEYERLSGDKEIRQAMATAAGFCGIVYICPKFYPDLDSSLRQKFFDNIVAIMKRGVFHWPNEPLLSSDTERPSTDKV
jgi:hypothetical protein